MEKNENGYSEYRFGAVGRGTSSSDDMSRPQNGCCGGCQASPAGEGSLAMVYSPKQSWRMLYSPDAALEHGTLFEELYKPLGECKNDRK